MNFEREVMAMIQFQLLLNNAIVSGYTSTLSENVAKLFPSLVIICVLPTVFKLYTSMFELVVPSILKIRVWHVPPFPGAVTGLEHAVVKN